MGTELVQGPMDEGALFLLLEAFRNGTMCNALEIASDMLYDRRPLGSVREKKDTEIKLLKHICNKVLTTSPMNKIALSGASYTAPKMFSNGAHMKKINSYVHWCELQKTTMSTS